MGSLTIRDFDPARDYPRLIELMNLLEPEPVTVEEIQERDERNGHIVLRRRWLGEVDGTVVGYSFLFNDPTNPPAHWWSVVVVDPAFRRRGFGRELVRPPVIEAASRSVEEILTFMREDDEATHRFAAAFEGKFVEHIFESVLVPSEVPDALLEGARPTGFSIVSFAEVLEEPDALSRLHALYVPIESDMPGLFGHRQRPYDNFEREIVRDPMFSPEGTFIAVVDGQWVGLAIVWEKDGVAYNQSTGVLAAFRGRGIASALKATAVEFCRARGVRTLRTNNHSSNAPMLAVNRKFGYRPEPGWEFHRFRMDSPALQRLIQVAEVA
jgi:GNAT superfamily N-acetyltransferase